MYEKENLIEKLIEKSLEKKISVEFIDDSFLFSNNEINNFLKIVFKFCSKNEICFNIIKEKFDCMKLELFDSKDIKSLSIKIRFDSDIEEEKEKYQKSVEKYKKYKIFPIIGPDGVGKTSLLTSIIADINSDKILYKGFKKIVRRSVLYNLIHPITKNLLKLKFGHKLEKDQHDDIYYLLIFLCGIIHYPYLLFNSLIREKIVFIDRFFNDYLLENISFLDKNTLLRNNWKILVKFIPTVRWKIHLDASSEIILSRKKELTKDDIEKYRDYNFEIYLQKPSFIYTYINTGLEIDKCKLFLEHTLKKVLEN